MTPPPDAKDGALLEVRDLRKYFPVRGGVLNRAVGWVQAVDDIGFDVLPGEVLGIVGESGCGKSTTARLLMHLIRADAGRIAFDGKAVRPDDAAGLRALRRRMQMVFQDSYSSLNPRLPIEDTIMFGPKVHGVSAAEARERARELFALVEPGALARRTRPGPRCHRIRRQPSGRRMRQWLPAGLPGALGKGTGDRHYPARA